ncbi:ras GEF [Paxillus ammoniavirescens]|nr:ras GEF [Paxillus ammoniavirescens]
MEAAPPANPPASLTSAQFPPGAKTESVHSDEPAPPTSGIFDYYEDVIPRFNLEKTFPAILVPINLLRQVPQTHDLDALRALAQIFSHCLDAILDSMKQLPEPIRSSLKYRSSMSGVKFSREMFMGHVGKISADPPSSLPQVDIQAAMQFLDMTMSSLKAVLQVAAYEVAQSKPLPEPPVECEHLSSTEDSEESSGPSSPSAEDHSKASQEHTETGGSTDSHIKPQRTKLSAFFKPPPLRRRGKRKLAPHSDSSAVNSAVSSTLVHSDSDRSDRECGYVHISINIRDSLAKFPVGIEGPDPGNALHPEDATELWRDGNGLAQLASLKALVRYMTTKDAVGDLEIVDVFFLCFRFFSNSKEVFDTFVARYNETPSERLSPSQAQARSLRVKMRVARLLYLWVELHWRAEEDAEVFDPLTKFAFSPLSQDIPHEASLKLVNALHDRACDNSQGLRVQKTIALAEAKSRQELICSTWEPREKRFMREGGFSKMTLQHFNCPGGVEMLALQLTLLLWEKYCAFEPEDAVRYLMVRKGNDSTPPSEVARKVATFISYEQALHRFVMDSIGSAESVEKRTELTEFFLDWASKCHELRNYSGSCLMALACDRPTVLPFITTLKLSPRHEEMKITLSEFYTKGNNHMQAYKQALQKCSCPALPGMMLFIGEVARGCGAEPYDQHPAVPGSRLINLKRYRPIAWAVRAMEKCHNPFKIQRVDYVCDWLEHMLSKYRSGTEAEWEERIYKNCHKP